MVLSGSSGRSSGQLQNESGSQPHDQSRSQTLKTVLVLGATGATGQHVVRQLIQRGCLVKAVVRDVTRLPMDLQESESLEVVVGSIHTMTPDQLKVCVAGCDDVVSCLGHRLSVAGILGPPWRLVKRSLKSVCEVMQQTHSFDTHASIDFKSTLHRQTYVEGEELSGVDTGMGLAAGGSGGGVASGATSGGRGGRVVLMGSTGCMNPLADETVGFMQRVVVGLIRLLIPPHADNEAAVDYLAKQVGVQQGSLKWVVVRPDGLVDQETLSAYDVVPSPTRSAIFDPGKTSRINAADFMAQLLTDDELWKKWVYQMPVIYNQDG